MTKLATRRSAKAADTVAVRGVTNDLADTTKDAATAAVVEDSRPPSKAALVLALLQRDEGASLQQLVEATGWLPHTTRAALTGLKRRGHTVFSDKPDGVRIYRVTVAAGAA